jgi:hypothetical protein
LVACGGNSAKAPQAGAVQGHKEVLAALLGLHFGKIDGPVANGVVLELLFGHAEPVLRQRQTTDAVALQPAGQGRARQVGNRRLPRVAAGIERQQGVPTKGYGDGFLPGAQHR